MMMLGKFRKKWDRLRSARQLLLEYAKYMQPGRYVLFPNMRVFALDNEKTVQSVVNDLGYHRAASVIEKLQSRLGSCVLREKQCNDLNYYGSILYINNNYPEPIRVRIFDPENKTVLVLYRDEQKYHQERELLNELTDFFRFPQIVSEKEDELAYIEKMIVSVPRPTVSEEEKCFLFEKIAGQYEVFAKAYVRSGRDVPTFDRRCLCITKEHGNELPMAFPMIPQHNDLSTLNIIVDASSEAHVIDWEHYGYNIFYYDLLRWIINDSQRENDDALLKAFLAGKFDAVMGRLFRIFGMNYSIGMRISYLDAVFYRMIQIAKDSGIPQIVLENMIQSYHRKIEELSDND